MIREWGIPFLCVPTAKARSKGLCSAMCSALALLSFAHERQGRYLKQLLREVAEHPVLEIFKAQLSGG